LADSDTRTILKEKYEGAEKTENVKEKESEEKRNKRI
jgi:hypothetical protein